MKYYELFFALPRNDPRIPHILNGESDGQDLIEAITEDREYIDGAVRLSTQDIAFLKSNIPHLVLKEVER